jgi:tRNA uridine 5-carboxymethylaminomethyl modification enzyme
MSTETDQYDVIVVGSGHAGCEAALAAARMGRRTAVFTLSLDNIALMPCNPSVGGPGKGHLVREIDALGGEMAKNTDRTSIQIRRLNTSKGPAVQALRAQSDKRAYSQAMRSVVADQAGLDVKQAMIDDLLFDWAGGGPCVTGVVTSNGAVYRANTVILTTGTFLKGRIITGDESYPAGRLGEFPADKLSASLGRCGFVLGRLKTGTPPRIDGRTIDYSLTEVQSGSSEALFFSYDAQEAARGGRMAAPSPFQPIADFASSRAESNAAWRRQMDCFAIQTSDATHDVIRANLHRAPMYNGGITSAGPRYCPSIETKIVRFAEKSSHHLFLEPEGWHTREMYLQGANTSLPEDVQLAMIRTIPALRDAQIMRPGYAIEYDYLPGTQVRPTLESKLVANLFLAGQIIGTTGYEEAGSLGLMAGINAAQRAGGQAGLVLGRDQAYIGVLIDDLVTKEMDEPYRMHTCQAEYRLLLRQDNADTRLGDLGHSLGLVDEERHTEVQRRTQQVEAIANGLESTWLSPNARNNQLLTSMGCAPLDRAVNARDMLCHSGVDLKVLQKLDAAADDVLPEVAREVETIARYSGYIDRQSIEVERLRRLEGHVLPEVLNYHDLHGMRTEARERLNRIHPRTVGQAARVAGVSPSDISVLLVYLERERRQSVAR